MGIPSGVRAIAAIALLVVSAVAYAQTSAPATPQKLLTDQDIKNLLVWNSPWESRTSTPGEIYSYRTTFVLRRSELIAQVMRYSNNERGNSVVNIREGRVSFQDSTGGEVNVSVDNVGELVGTATSKTTNISVVFKGRP